ncbi:phosphatase PAP2 family protein [Nocardiopsis composta]|uniref:Membrane-associated phospholipid phosphatase n=1 Tax=Nocardiopsis composta TaxID=157465 RepID=A0A7W8VGS2_9ACTN|nr:phosphatase PAP2 family protein [Nocardiopsis composta]MBB5435926.1 membrane-associated phospholipid phosphatase [Nocardiopsis composta]
MPPTATAPAPAGNRLARAATGLLAPAQAVAYIVAVTAAHSAGSAPQAVLWGLQAALFGAVVPAGFIAAGVRRGWWEDRHVRDGRKRRWPLLVCLASTAAGTAVGAALGGPRDLVVLGAVMCAVALVLWVFTDPLRTKPSVHTLIAVIASGVSAVYLGAAGAAAALPLTALVAWSRLRLRHHTPPQVLGGALIGAAASLLFTLLR